MTLGRGFSRSGKKQTARKLTRRDDTGIISPIMGAQQQPPATYFREHPVFRFEDFSAFHAGRSPLTTASVLGRHVQAGNLLHLRRGLYATVPAGADPATFPVDPFLLAAHHTEDAVLAYHAALQLRGRVYSPWSRFHVLTARRSKTWSWRGVAVAPVQVDRQWRDHPGWGGGIETVRHAGGTLKVTTFERTLVDLLDQPDKGGGWEETWRSLEMVEFFDLDAVVDLALRLGTALTVARVGLFLDQHREALLVEERHLVALTERIPAGPTYLDSRRTPGRLVSRWKLVVPEALLHRTWEEPG
jgi:predicted transcriptional regulator of viral defense system